MGKIMKDGISYSGSTYTGGTDIEITGANVINAKVRELTQAQYDALSSAEKNNGTTYYITDGIPSIIGVTDVTDGNTSIVSNHVADITHKVNKSGDTMTGDLNTTASFANKYNGVEVDNSSTNHVSSDTQLTSVEFKDKNDFVYSGLNTQVSTSGLIETWLNVKNKKTDGSVVSNYIDLLVAKDGTRSYEVADPAAFRNAIGLTTSTTTLTSPVSQIYYQHIEKKNDVVYLYIDINNLNITTDTFIGNIPLGFRPQHRINYEALVIASSDASFKGYAHINIQTNGNISYKSLGSYTQSFTTINIAYPVD